MEQGNALPVGTQLGGYEILAVLGRGGFGITYRVYDPTLAKVLALKEYLPGEFALRTADSRVGPTSEGDVADYEWGLKRFVDEARALARFDHPHINKVHRFFEANGTAYMVLEYVEGETLSVVLQRQPTLRQGAVKRLLAEVLSGLEEVHGAGYVHRDLKPGNLMVQPDGSTVILDFGAARQAVGQRSKSITTILTPGYAPIEQYDTKAEDVGPWSDLYALGMVAYRSISGLSDTDLPDAVTRTRNVRKGVAALAPAVTLGRGRYDARLLAAIDWAMQLNEEERPQSVEEWRAALPPLEAEAPPTPRPTTSVGPAPDTAVQAPVPTPGRVTVSVPRWVTVVGLVGLVVVLIGGAYWLGQRGSVVAPEQAAVSPPADLDQGQATKPTPPVSPPTSAPSKPAAPVPSEYPFVVETAPVGAEVEVLGIEEVYRAGVALPVGRYQLEVRAEGYEPQRVWVEHTASGGPHRVELAAVRQPFTIVAVPAGGSHPGPEHPGALRCGDGAAGGGVSSGRERGWL